MTSNSSYAAAGVDTHAGDLAVELMKEAVAATHGPNVLGGVGGFAGLFDLSFAKDYAKPLLATSTDGVGTKIAIAQALDRKKDYPGAANLVRKLMFLDKLDEEIDLAYEEVD